MKTQKIFFALLFTIIGSFATSAQVGIGTTTPHASAAFEISSTTGGLLLPRLSSAERLLINNSTPATGLLIYNTTLNCIEWFDGTNWINACNDTPNASKSNTKDGKVAANASVNATESKNAVVNTLSKLTQKASSKKD